MFEFAVILPSRTGARTADNGRSQNPGKTIVVSSASVEHDQLAGHVRRCIAGEVQRGADDLVCAGNATETDPRRQLRPQVFRRQRSVQAVGVKRSADDGVDADAAWSELVGRGLGERVET